MTQAASPRRQRGFSLLEVLVAFVIMAMSLGALYQTLGSSVRGFAGAEAGIRAALIADSLFALYDVVPEMGIDESGVDSDQFAWRVTSEPYDLGVEAPPWRLHRLMVDVSWAERGGTKRLALWSLRPVIDTP